LHLRDAHWHLQFTHAKDAYERVLEENPTHSKVLQQLGWIYHQEGNFQNQDMAITCLTKSLESGKLSPQQWAPAVPDLTKT
jgi:glucose repression mediator protein